MLDLEADMAAFFDEEGFAVACERDRPGENVVTFSGIVSTTDAPQFDGDFTLGRHRLLFATAAVDLREGDTLTITARNQAGTALPAQTWRVMRDAERVLDGLQSVVYIKPKAEQ
jgi:hypothetical protein